MTRRLKGERFASVYERFLYSDLSDRAVRLLLVLDRHADDSGGSFPQRPRLAELLNCSVDTVDRLIAEAVRAGAITVEKVPRPRGGQPLSVFHLWPSTPEQSRTVAAMQSRTHAAVKAAPTRPSKPQTEGAAPSIEREPRNESQGSTAADAAPPTGAEARDQLARKVLERVWDRKKQADQPVPANYLGALAATKKLLAAGWDPHDLVRAMLEAPTISTGAVELVLNRRGTTKPRPMVDRIDQDRDAPSGFLVAP